MSGQIPEGSSRRRKLQNLDESTECRNGKSGVHANTPLNWSVSYKRFGLTHGRNSNDETVSNLTRRRKAGRLQEGIDRYLPVSGHGECTVTRCWRESSTHRRGPTRMVQSVGVTVVASPLRKDARYSPILDGGIQAREQSTLAIRSANELTA